MSTTATFTYRSLLGAAAFAGLIAATPAFAATDNRLGTPNASVIAMNQKMKDGAVSITYAFLPKDGTLEIYAVGSSGKVEGSPLGKIALTAGDHRNFKVDLKSAARTGAELRAVVAIANQPLKNSGDIPERTFKVL